MAKPKTKFVCENCGHSEPKWVGKCPSCGEWNTFIEETVIESSFNAIKRSQSPIEQVNLKSVEVDEHNRQSTKFHEFDRVLGGGLVQNEVILISGEPGIGKSTLLLQTANNLAKDSDILYVSGEESAQQIALRASRLFGGLSKTNDISFISHGGLNAISDQILLTHPGIVIIDSIQTLFDEDVAGLPGGLAQVRACSSKLIQLAKQNNFILIIVGHINKDGRIAGPKVLEHLVDCVLQFEGQRDGEFRVLRSIKNRFGSTGEVGIFVMIENGLQDLSKENSMFSSTNTSKEQGVAKTLVIEGSRPLIVDIQALASKTVFPYPKRVSEGVSMSKLQVLSAIIGQIKGINILDLDVYIKTSSGYSLKNYSYADLGVIAAMYSSIKNTQLDQQLIFLGEVTLNGNIHVPANYQKYIKEIARLFPKSTIVGPKYKHNRFISLQNIKELPNILK
ncbi:DNA repair protein RadA [Candidatus Dojkabacteria bacterium]|uniref:DNA repair protein RadA n=1 Tax=Candidatus Dojkabacteria bacterium TaxID=2099670 RepID=A0A955LAK3_9BACT|nr:DNA repair protein RadA [Candidatus Dojkabacteria bacterium]